MKKRAYCVIVLLMLTVCFALCACGKEDNSSKTELSTPQNLHMEGRVLVWDEVENATGYVVYFENSSYKTSECRHDLTDLYTLGTYEIKVVAVDDTAKYGNSKRASFSYTVEEIIEHGYDESGLEYTLLEDGSGYEVSRGKHDLKGFIEFPDYYNDLPVKRIGEKIFYPLQNDNLNGGMAVYFNKLTTGVKLPAKLESIGKLAFAYMRKLEEVVIPDTVTEIEKEAFSDCIALKRVTLPKGLKVIPDGCFKNCSLTEIAFPDSLEEIGASAFIDENRSFNETDNQGKYLKDDQGKYILVGAEQNFTEIYIPDSVKRIESSAFSGCKKLESIRLPNGLEWLGGGAFNGTAWYDSQPDGFVTLGNILYKYKGEIEEGAKVELPSTVKKIAGAAFSGQKRLAEFVIPDGVKLVGSGIFASCSSLASVRLPSDLKEISNSIFFNCKELRSIEIPSGVTKIGDQAFYGCQSLNNVVIPNGVTKIGDDVFNSCQSLDNVVIPNGVTEIGKGAFNNCKGLTSVVIPNGVTKLGDSCFNKCESLTSVVLPSKIKLIGKQAFSGCKALTSIVIPKSVEVLGMQPFYGCENLERIYFEGTETEWNNLKAVYNVTTVSGGKTFPVQNPFSNAVIYTYSETMPITLGNYWHYVNNQPALW